MANPTDARAANAPYWSNDTTVSSETLTGGFDQITVTGYYVIISNTGANNVSIGPDNVTAGVLVQPDGSFQTAIRAGAPLYVTGTAAQTVSVVQYVG